ncbi:hypothetical protein BU25DRAFT_463250 [Macroventuria anomochaeta]|uniref:Uncharacterized protein n=1 Tax=Macroventuria anomochaeta TaxID=301207 RepID=A0ACB6RM05_9PLEO|nr:uncharacterized protein BU25DRAFT_463250 [Macroventuria anomochaeta]KAF2621954.1 hypothetical protein BU25DRAFT_463250 [Macroventuria anomochaeta]
MIDVANFLHRFIIAWMDYAMDPAGAKENNFLLRDQFMESWKSSDYDLIHLPSPQSHVVSKLVADLQRRELSPRWKARLSSGAISLMNDRRPGRMSDAEWEKTRSKASHPLYDDYVGVR